MNIRANLFSDPDADQGYCSWGKWVLLAQAYIWSSPKHFCLMYLVGITSWQHFFSLIQLLLPSPWLYNKSPLIAFVS